MENPADYPEYGGHPGYDEGLPLGTPVLAACGGTVTLAGAVTGPRSARGIHVVIDHGGGLESYYMHLSAVDCQPGDMVQAGELIGWSGSTGQSTGAHLHWDVRLDGVPVDPESVLS